MRTCIILTVFILSTTVYLVQSINEAMEKKNVLFRIPQHSKQEWSQNRVSSNPLKNRYLHSSLSTVFYKLINHIVSDKPKGNVRNYFEGKQFNSILKFGKRFSDF